MKWFIHTCDSGAIQLDPGNIDGIIENNDLVLVNFYADWCRFSNMLAPIWDQTADRVAADRVAVDRCATINAVDDRPKRTTCIKTGRIMAVKLE